MSDAVREQSRLPSPAVHLGRIIFSGHRTWLVCGHESLGLRSYLGIGSEAVFCCCLLLSARRAFPRRGEAGW